MKRETQIAILGAVVGLIALAAFIMPSGDAEAFFGNDDGAGAWVSDGHGQFVTDSTGYGKGKGSAEGNFSMTINASGTADTEMKTDVDNMVNAHGRSDNNVVSTNGDYR